LDVRLPTTPPPALRPRAPLGLLKLLNSLASAALFEQSFVVVKQQLSHARTVQRLFRASIGRNALHPVRHFSARAATGRVQLRCCATGLPP
jgi:hypothetical protein